MEGRCVCDQPGERSGDTQSGRGNTGEHWEMQFKGHSCDTDRSRVVIKNTNAKVNAEDPDATGRSGVYKTSSLIQEAIVVKKRGQKDSPDGWRKSKIQDQTGQTEEHPTKNMGEPDHNLTKAASKL